MFIISTSTIQIILNINHYTPPTRDKVKGKISDDDITMIKYLCINMKQHKIQKKDIAKYYNVSRPAISKISLGELFGKHIAEFETTINGGSYKVIDDNRLNIWKDKNKSDIENIVKHIKQHNYCIDCVNKKILNNQYLKI